MPLFYTRIQMGLPYCVLHSLSERGLNSFRERIIVIFIHETSHWTSDKEFKSFQPHYVLNTRA